MLEPVHKGGPRPKCYFTHSVLPTFVDHEHPSQKKKPFSTIREHPFAHTVDIVVLQAAHGALLDQLKNNTRLRYAKVYMKLSDVIEGSFFNEYVKTGNILMLSEGRPGLDNVFSLRDGLLRLDLDKPTYERTGLSGTVIPSEGRKHVKARYAVQVNLRLPSMVRGKHGFERLLWAFKNVLNSRSAWLFHDLKGPNDGSGPIAAHQPILKTADPEITSPGTIVVPDIPDAVEEGDQQTALELLEWLSLLASQSPRVRQGDAIDENLSRYRAPGSEEHATLPAEQLTILRWRGFMPSEAVQDIAIAALKLARQDWFAFSSRSFDGKTHAFLQRKEHTFTWEFES